MSEFQDELSSLLLREAPSAAKLPDRAERMGDMIETLACGLGFMVSIAANGDPEGIETMIAAAERYALEEAADKADFAKFMAVCRGRP